MASDAQMTGECGVSLGIKKSSDAITQVMLYQRLCLAVLGSLSLWFAIALQFLG